MLDTPRAFNNPELRRLMRLCRLEHTFVQGEGVWLTDADGRRYLDAYAQYGAVALGHAAPEVAAAVRAALDARVPAMVPGAGFVGAGVEHRSSCMGCRALYHAASRYIAN